MTSTKNLDEIITRPECAGWHERDEECDGSEVAKPCAYRRHCLVLVELAGGREERTDDSVRIANETNSGAMIQVLADRQVMMHRMERRPLSARSRTSSTGVEIPVAAPSPRFFHALPIVRAIGQCYAKELGLGFVDESSDLKKGDVFLRFLPGHDGRQVVLYEYHNDASRSEHGLWIARLNMARKRAFVSLRANCDDLEAAVFAGPPTGLRCYLWKDVRPLVAMTRIEVSKARAAGRWLAELRRRGAIGYRRRKR